MEPPDATRAYADDLRFVHALLGRGGHVRRLDHVLCVYRHHNAQLSHMTPRSLLMRVRARALEARVLRFWPRFSVWGAGRDAKAFLACISGAARGRVAAFAEVNPRKIGTVYENAALGVAAPVVHWSCVRPPVVVCVARGRTNGELERNMRAAGLTEGLDCWCFV